MTGLVLRAGACYLDRLGMVVGPLERLDPPRESADPSRPYEFALGTSALNSWTADGTFNPCPRDREPVCRDLVQEAPGPVPRPPVQDTPGPVPWPPLRPSPDPVPRPLVSTLDMEHPGWYRQRDGEVLGPITPRQSSSAYKWQTGRVPDNPDRTWTSKGRHLQNSAADSPYDLVEYLGPNDPAHPAPAPEPEKPVKHIDQMTLPDFRRGVEKVHASFRIRH